MQIKTTDLGRLKGVPLTHGIYGDLWTLAPGQTTAPGSLVLTGDPRELAAVTPAALSTEPPGALEFTFGSRKPDSIDLAVRAKGTGRVIVRAGNEAVGVVGIGEHASHLGDQAVDLLAQVSNGQDARKVVAIQQILQNHRTPIIDQLSGPYGNEDRLICGTVVDQAGRALFGRVDYSDRSYHRPIKRGAGIGDMPWDKITYDPLTTQIALTKIKGLLDRGTPVRVGAVYKPEWSMLAANGALQAEKSGGHSILIVGYTGSRFLYLDPFVGLSRTKYQGGLSFNKDLLCRYLGVLEITTTNGLHLTAKVEGSRLQAPNTEYMSVISGPLH
ncbi:MAG TPA: hypothetical protein VHU40_19125 [Polyangia bacterium]|nr:hypothetical protein [Polyangia bacterium]